MFGYGSRAIRVIGGVAGTQWSTTLTDESPTSFPEGRDKPSYKSKTKGAADAMER
jgi:hypothetical protein